MAAKDVPTKGVFAVWGVERGDTLTLATQNDEQLQIVVAYINCPKLSRRLPSGEMTPEEKGAYDAFEFTRSQLIGKQVRYEEESRIEAIGRSSGPVTMPDGKDLGLELVRAGLATVPDRKPQRMNKDLHDRYLDAMTAATRAGKGMWGKDCSARVVKPYAVAPAGLVDKLIAQCKKGDGGATIKCLVEKVISGSHLSVFAADNLEQQITVTLCGITCPSAVQKDANGRPFPMGAAAKQHTERFLLNRNIGLRFDGVDAGNGFALVSVVSPKGTFQEDLLRRGMARTQTATIVYASAQNREAMLKTEAEAQKEKVGLWKDGAASSTVVVAAASAADEADAADGADEKKASGTGTAAAASKTGEIDFLGTIVQVVSGDTIVVRGASTEELGVPSYHRLQLAGVRAPRVVKRADGSDPTTRGTETRNSYEEYTFESKEFMRKKFIGCAVQVHIESVLPSQDAGREPRRTASMKEAGAAEGTGSLSAALLGAGLAKIQISRNEAPPADLEEMLSAEAMARSKKLGVHNTEKPAPATNVTELNRIGEKKGRSYLSFLQRTRVINGCVVDTVLSGTAFRVYVPREHFVITLKLAGVSSPAGPAPGASGGGDKYWQESKDFAVLQLQNREVDIIVESSDRTGSFIGYVLVKPDAKKEAAVAAPAAAGAPAAATTAKKAPATAAAAAPQPEHFAIAIVQAGLAAALGAERTIISQQLLAAQKAAVEAKRFIFSSSDALPARVAKREAAHASQGVVFTTQQDHPWVPITITDVRSNSSVYVVVENKENKENKATIDELLRQLSTTGGTSVDETNSKKSVKRNDIVAVLFREDKSWNRARVLNVYDKDCEVQFLDFGNVGEPSLKDVRTIPPNSASEKWAPLRDLPPLAEAVSLAYIHPMQPDSENLNSAIDRVWMFAQDESSALMGRVEYTIGGDKNHVAVSRAANYSKTLQEALLSEGLSVIEAGVLKAAKGNSAMTAPQNGTHNFFFKAMEGAMDAARKAHRGVFIYGDNFSDDDD